MLCTVLGVPTRDTAYCNCSYRCCPAPSLPRYPAVSDSTLLAAERDVLRCAGGDDTPRRPTGGDGGFSRGGLRLHQRGAAADRLVIPQLTDLSARLTPRNCSAPFYPPLHPPSPLPSPLHLGHTRQPPLLTHYDRFSRIPDCDGPFEETGHSPVVSESHNPQSPPPLSTCPFSPLLTADAAARRRRRYCSRCQRSITATPTMYNRGPATTLIITAISVASM